MALVLNIKIDDDFYVNDAQFILQSISSPSACVLKRIEDGELFNVSDSHSTQIYPETRVFVGLDSQNTFVRLGFEAPKAVKILTGSNYKAHPSRND